MRNSLRFREHASIGGKNSVKKRMAGRDPKTIRNKKLGLRVSENELQMINDNAKAASLSRTEFLVRLVKNHNIS